MRWRSAGSRRRSSAVASCRSPQSRMASERFLVLAAWRLPIKAATQESASIAMVPIATKPPLFASMVVAYRLRGFSGPRRRRGSSHHDLRRMEGDWGGDIPTYNTGTSTGLSHLGVQFMRHFTRNRSRGFARAAVVLLPCLLLLSACKGGGE